MTTEEYFGLFVTATPPAPTLTGAELVPVIVGSVTHNATTAQLAGLASAKYPNGQDFADPANTLLNGAGQAVADLLGNIYSFGTIVLSADPGSARQAIVNLAGVAAWGSTPVADGTYTVGAKLTGGGVNGTITVVNGIVTAVQAAT